MNKKRLTTLTLVEVALIAAVICVMAPWSIPLAFSPVPISLGVFAVLLGTYAIGWKWGSLSCLIYMLLGLVGLPVFSKFTSGPGVLFGPTGGYIFGYLGITLIGGFFIQKFEKKIYMHAVGMILGVLVCYVFGTAWFMIIMDGMTLGKALTLCVIPFIPADAVKIALSLLVGPSIRKGIKALNNK